MKQFTLLLGLTVLAAAFLTGCGQQAKSAAILADLFPNEVESVTVNRWAAGTDEEFIVEGSGLEALKDWAASLSVRKVSFEDGGYPGQNEEGGEIYDFYPEGNDASLSYRSFGDSYLVIRDEWYFVSNPTTPPLEEGTKVAADRIPMVMVDGTLYLDTGKESAGLRRCGTMDGEITSTVGRSEIPAKDNQSNFGSGYGYQYGANHTIEICINDRWFIFEEGGLSE